MRNKVVKVLAAHKNVERRDLRCGLQLFADGDGEDGKDPDDKDDDPEEKKYTDEEVDALIERKFAEWQKKHEKQQAKLDEAERLKNMTDQERKDHEMEELRKQVSALQKKETMSKMSSTARSMLSAKGITVGDDLVGMLISEDADATKSAVDSFITAFQDAVTKAVKDALKGYSLSTGRSCMLLQGGRRVADIAVLWPIQSVQAESWMFRDQTSGLPIANWVPDNVVNYTLSDILTDSLQRDFTYIHPENLSSGKVTVNGRTLTLNNRENIQEYQVLIIPGGDYISADALKEIYSFYNNGGKVIVLASLPSRSSEFGRDREITETMESIFGPVLPVRDTAVTGQNGGMFIFSSSCNAGEISKMLELTGYMPDAIFPDAAPDNAGYINYLHKVRNGRNFYYITNTTDKEYDREISLRGEFRKVEIWDPHTGDICPADARIQDGRTYVPVSVPPVRSCFIVTK